MAVKTTKAFAVAIALRTPEDQAIINGAFGPRRAPTMYSMLVGDQRDAAIMSHDNESRRTGFTPAERATLMAWGTL